MAEWLITITSKKAANLPVQLFIKQFKSLFDAVILTGFLYYFSIYLQITEIKYF